MNEQVKLTHPGCEFAMYLNDVEFKVYGPSVLKNGWVCVNIANNHQTSTTDRPVIAHK